MSEQKRTFEEMMAEYQELMKRQVELQKEMFGTQMGMMNQMKGPIEDALKNFMGSFADAMQGAMNQTQKQEKTSSEE